MRKDTPDDRPLRAITGFHLDDEGHWVAELECGHSQHMRHQPPWQVRLWVLTEEGRAGFIGTEIPCSRCGDRGSGIGDRGSGIGDQEPDP